MTRCSSTCFTYCLPILDEMLLHLLHLPPPYPWLGAPPPPSLTAFLSWWGAPPPPSLTTSLSLLRCSFTYRLSILDKALLHLLHLLPPYPCWGAPLLTASLSLTRHSSTSSLSLTRRSFTYRLSILDKALLHLPPPYHWWGAPPPLSLTASLSLTRRSSTFFTYRLPVLDEALLHLFHLPPPCPWQGAPPPPCWAPSARTEPWPWCWEPLARRSSCCSRWTWAADGRRRVRSLYRDTLRTARLWNNDQRIYHIKC